MTQSFLDLAGLVASESATKGTFDDLAYAIGRDAYADLNGWHLFLKDMSTVPGGPKMHTVLAEQLGTQACFDYALDHVLWRHMPWRTLCSSC